MMTYDCRCTPTLKCCTEGVMSSSLPQLEKERIMEKEARIITRGTLRLQDLLEAYASELEAVRDYNDRGSSALEAQAYSWTEQLEQLENESDDDAALLVAYEEAFYVLEDLEEALNNYAPEGYYFGTDPNTPDEKGWLPIEEDE